MTRFIFDNPLKYTVGADPLMLSAYALQVDYASFFSDRIQSDGERGWRDQPPPAIASPFSYAKIH